MTTPAEATVLARRIIEKLDEAWYLKASNAYHSIPADLESEMVALLTPILADATGGGRARESQADAWLTVIGLCRELGMDSRDGKGVDLVCDYIRGLHAAKTPPADAGRLREQMESALRKCSGILIQIDGLAGVGREWQRPLNHGEWYALQDAITDAERCFDAIRTTAPEGATDCPKCGGTREYRVGDSQFSDMDRIVKCDHKPTTADAPAREAAGGEREACNHKWVGRYKIHGQEIALYTDSVGCDEAVGLGMGLDDLLAGCDANTERLQQTVAALCAAIAPLVDAYKDVAGANHQYESQDANQRFKNVALEARYEIAKAGIAAARAPADNKDATGREKNDAAL